MLSLRPGNVHAAQAVAAVGAFAPLAALGLVAGDGRVLDGRRAGEDSEGAALAGAASGAGTANGLVVAEGRSADVEGRGDRGPKREGCRCDTAGLGAAARAAVTTRAGGTAGAANGLVADECAVGDRGG
jgi:hypothetical protein